MAPTGWPRAMAPPFGLTLSGSRPSPLMTAQRLRGERLVRLDDVEVARPSSPARSEHLLHRRDRADAHDLGVDAGMGVARRTRARGFSPSALARVGGGEHDGAAAPSLMPEALPAVTVPSFLKTGRSLASCSAEVVRSARRCRMPPCRASPVTSIGTISLVEAALGDGGRRAGATSRAKASCASRVICARRRGFRR